MVLKPLTLLLGAMHLILCHPAPKDASLPPINISNPYEINNLNYYNANTDPEPEESKLFRRTVSSIEKSANYIDKTVREVESLISANSTLPRLTRGEILEIIQNITKTDSEKQQGVNKVPERDQKAIMLVMPYTPDNVDEGKMQELFTKPPVTRIIGEAPKQSQVEVKPTTKRRRRPFPQTPQGGFYGEVFPEPLPERKPTKSPQKKPNLSINLEPPLENRPAPVFTQKPLVTSTTEKPKSTKSPTQPVITTYKPSVRISTTESVKHRRASPKPFTTSTEISVFVKDNPSTTTTKIPQRKRRPSKSPQRFPNHKYPEDSQASFVNEGLKLVESPKFSPTDLKSPTTTRKVEKFGITTVSPAKSSKPHPFTAADPVLPSINLPDDLKATLEDLNLGDSFNNKPIKYEPDTVSYFKPPPLKENVKEILASIGVFPSTTTTTPIPDISNVADTLNPDMKKLLMSFGLLPDPNYKPTVVNDEPSIGVPTAEVNPNSYIQFKPLPDGGPTRGDMEEFLGRFGLGRNSKNTRNQKAISLNKTEKVLTEVPRIQEDMVPTYMRDVLIDLGLTDRQGKKIRAQSFHKILDKTNEKEETTKKDNVFSPMETSYASEDELEKLNQLLDIIKQLEKLNGTATEKDLNKLDLKNLKDLVGSLNKEEFVPLDEQEWAPDPLNYDSSVNKNQVKRQQNSSSSTEVVFTVTPAASTSTTTTTTTTTEEPKTPDIKDLEDSFGGPSNSGPVATLPPPTEAPKTGFYYLLDWNTFLDIDDQKGKRVNLRFQPKVGDSKQFYSVNVP